MDATKLIEEAGQLTTEEFASGATNGPWRVDDLVVIMAGEEAVAECFSVKDARFIARARTLVPELAAALKASEERAKAAELDAASLRAAWKIADRTSLTAECQAHAKTSFDLLGVAKERDALAAANLAANKRIVELEHERDEWMRRAEGWESEAAIATERFNRLAAAQPGEPLDMDCGDSSCAFAKTRGGMRTNGGCRCLENLGFCRGQTDSLRRMGAEIVSLRKRLSDLTTPRPIAEAPRDGTWVLGYWDETTRLDAGRYSRFLVVQWLDGEWLDEDGDELNEPTHYLPLPEVKP
jgi:hypothetical protein